MKSKTRDAVLMTVYNRPELTMMNVLAALSKNDLAATAVIVVDDGSTEDQSNVRTALRSFGNGHWLPVDVARYVPSRYHISGTNNPAYAFQRGFEFATDELGAERLFVMSSDVMIPPHALDRFRSVDLEKFVALGAVIDLDTANTLCSSRVIWPMPWFVGVGADQLEAIGGWDLEFMNGIAFEDNDLMARLLLHVGALMIRDDVMCWHQSHPQTAYSDEKKGWNQNEKYIVEKFGDVPFRPGSRAIGFDVRTTRRGMTYLINPQRLTETVDESPPPTPDPETDKVVGAVE